DSLSPWGVVIAGVGNYMTLIMQIVGNCLTVDSWHVERTHAWQNAFHRLARCYERRVTVIDAFFDLADTIITVRSLNRQAWTTHRWDERPNRRP
ncbi:hypothetical protein M2271_008226, partial [Streptomyces sp. LBL]|nr:hypothetical protein [Streptomyces sp. LBL]